MKRQKHFAFSSHEKLRFSRRAQAKLVLPPVFIMALGLGVVFLSLIYAVMQIASNEAYVRQLYITGLGFNLQALQALGTDINAEREIDEAGAYTLFFEGTKVYTKERGKETSIFLFTHDPDFVFNGGEFSPRQNMPTIGPLKLYKTGKLYGTAKPADVPSPYLLTCDTPKGVKLKKIVLDPGHGYDATTAAGDEGYKIAGGTAESAYVLKLANSLKAGRTRFVLTRDREEPIPIDIRQKTTGDALISLHIGNRADNQDVVKAYYNPTPESKRLACEILNEITTRFKVPVRPIPVNFDLIPDNDPKQVIRGTRPAVLLELGNSQKADSILKEDKQLALQIYKGVEKYGVE